MVLFSMNCVELQWSWWLLQVCSRGLLFWSSFRFCLYLHQATLAIWIIFWLLLFHPILLFGRSKDASSKGIYLHWRTLCHSRYARVQILECFKLDFLFPVNSLFIAWDCCHWFNQTLNHFDSSLRFKLDAIHHIAFTIFFLCIIYFNW